MNKMVDMDKPVKVTYQGRTLFEGKVERTMGCLAKTLQERGDRELMFSWVRGCGNKITFI